MRILLVEDDNRFADALMFSLEELDIQRVISLVEARHYLSYNSIDMMLIDLGLPDSRGLDTLRALKHYPGSKVIITSTHDTGEAAKLGAYDYIVKEASIVDIAERVRFNIDKMTKCRGHFGPGILEQVKACFPRQLFNRMG